jgi:hypothetical protein
MAERKDNQNKSNQDQKVSDTSVNQQGAKKTKEPFVTSVLTTRKNAGKAAAIVETAIDQPATDSDLRESSVDSEGGFGCARGLIVIPPEFDDPIEGFSDDP